MQQLQGRQCQGPEAVLCGHSQCEGHTIGCCCCMTADSCKVHVLPVNAWVQTLLHDACLTADRAVRLLKGMTPCMTPCRRGQHDTTNHTPHIVTMPCNKTNSNEQGSCHVLPQPPPTATDRTSAVSATIQPCLRVSITQTPWDSGPYSVHTAATTAAAWSNQGRQHPVQDRLVHTDCCQAGAAETC